MPSPSPEKERQSLTVAAALLREMIERTQFAVSLDETRLNLSGIFFERPEAGKLRLVSTDGHRLSMVTRAIDDGSSASGVIIPRKGIGEISKVIEGGDDPVTITLQGGVAHVSRGGVDLSIRLVEGEFPDYKQVIPQKGERRMHVVAGDLLAALRRVSVVSSERTRGVKLQLDRDRLEISSVNPDLGEASEEIAVEYESEGFGIGFNARYFIDVLTVLPPETHIDLAFNDEVSPGVVHCEGDPDYLYVVMPMRL